MGLFNAFKSDNDKLLEEKIENENKLLEKIALKDKTIQRLEDNIDNKNKEINALEAKINSLKTEIEELKKESNPPQVDADLSDTTDEPEPEPVTSSSATDISDINKIAGMREKLVSAIKEKTKIKSYHITPTEITDGDIFMSKFGGLGYWDNSMEYPKDSEGNQLVLLAQINFDRDKFDDPALPTKGLLQFYILPDDAYGANFDELMNKNTYRVVFHENVNYDVKREDLADIKTNLMLDSENEFFPFNKELKIEFEEAYDYINPANDNFKEVLDDIVKEEFGIDISGTPLYKVFDDGIMDYLYKELTVSGSKLLGYPYFTQYDPRENKKYKEYKILLFQMDSDTEVDIMWGDFGIANFFIKENKDFSDVLYTWDCT